MGKRRRVLGLTVLMLGVGLAPTPRQTVLAQSFPTPACGDTSLTSPMQGHYSGPWHSNGDYHFAVFGTDLDLSVTIDGTLDVTVDPQGQISGNATGSVNAPITDYGRHDVSSGTGTISGQITGSLATGSAALVLSHPVIDMHWGTFVGGGYTVERFITMPDYQFAVGAFDCVSAQGTLSEQNFPQQTLVADGAGQVTQASGVGTAGGTWNMVSDAAPAYAQLSQQVDAFISDANAVLVDPTVRLTPALVRARIAQPLAALEASIRQNPNVARCLLQRLETWEQSVAGTLLARAQLPSADPDLVTIRSDGDLLDAALLVSPDCQVSQEERPALVDAAGARLDRAVATRGWSETAQSAREMLLQGGDGERGPASDRLRTDLHTLVPIAGAALDAARVAYAVGDDADARALAARAGSSHISRGVVSKLKKHRRRRAAPTPTPTPKPRTLEQTLGEGITAMSVHVSGSPASLTWQPVGGATRYLVVAESGNLLWAWSGTSTRVTYGDTAIDGLPGSDTDAWPIQQPSAGAQWSILALDGGGRIVGAQLRLTR